MRFALLFWALLTIAIPAVVALHTETGSCRAQNNNNNENRLLLPDVDREETNRRERGTMRQFPTESKLAQDQIIRDFRQLQLLNNQVREGAAHQDASYKSLIKPLGEMRKRATRLKSNLALKTTDVKKADPMVDSNLTSLLSKLDQSVNSLGQNPMLRNTQVIDVNLAKKARVDLEAVIELTKVISTRIDKDPR